MKSVRCRWTFRQNCCVLQEKLSGKWAALRIWSPHATIIASATATSNRKYRQTGSGRPLLPAQYLSIILAPLRTPERKTDIRLLAGIPQDFFRLPGQGRKDTSLTEIAIEAIESITGGIVRERNVIDRAIMLELRIKSVKQHFIESAVYLFSSMWMGQDSQNETFEQGIWRASLFLTIRLCLKTGISLWIRPTGTNRKNTGKQLARREPSFTWHHRATLYAGQTAQYQKGIHTKLDHTDDCLYS
jgi:hypothetical protein